MRHVGRSSHSVDPRRRRSVRAGFAAVALGVLALSAVAAPADATIRHRRQGEATGGGDDVLAATAEICELGGRGRLFVSHDGASACIAYYSTDGIDDAKVAVVYFEGDVPGSFRRDAAKLAQHRQQLRTVLGLLQVRHGVPFVFMARPGTFGSTGDHMERRSVREYRLLDAALTRLKELHRVERLVLTGQSGGATVVGAMLTFGRTDVVCATPASGGYDFDGLLAHHADRFGFGRLGRENGRVVLDNYNVVDNVAGIRADAGRRIFVVGDPADVVTPFELQRRFAGLVAEAGHHVRLVEARGTGKERHGLGHVGLRLAALCAKGETDAAIVEAAMSEAARP